MKIYKRPRSRFWWISYSIGGKRYRESTGTTSKRKAEALLAKRTNDIFEGRHFPAKKRTDMTMAKLRDMWLEHAKHKRSIKNDKTRFKAIMDFFGPGCLVATLSKTNIERFRDDLADRIVRPKKKKKMAPATVNRHLALLRAALRHVQGDYLHRNPMQGMKFLPERNKVERECEPKEYENLLKQATPDLRLAIVLAYEAGLRRVEVCRTMRENLNMRRRELHIPPADSKNDQPRTVPLTRKAVDEIKAAPARVDGKLLDMIPDDVTRHFRELCAELRIRKLRFHDLRGTAITRLARQGANLDELQKFSGHKSVQALMKYLKRGDKRLRKLVDAMEAEEG